MSIGSKIQKIRRLLGATVSDNIFDAISEELDDIGILSEAKDEVINSYQISGKKQVSVADDAIIYAANSINSISSIIHGLQCGKSENLLKSDLANAKDQFDLLLKTLIKE